MPRTVTAQTRSREAVGGAWKFGASEGNMLTYQVRRRVFRHEPGARLTFPALCLVRFQFTPEQPFGESATGGRTAVRAKPARVNFNMNTGEHSIESAEPLRPLDVTIEAPGRLLQLRGTALEVREEFASLKHLEDFLLSIFFGLPSLLNVRLADPPRVVRVDGKIAGVPFRWELAEWKMQFSITSQDVQEESFVTAWNHMGLLHGLARRRLLAALHYFYVAVRLDRSASNPGEFMAETILNLSKVLEVLFPSAAGGKTREAVRAGLRQLNYRDEEIERLFVPAMALRNQIDVGHVSLALLTTDQLSIIHAYTERAENAFREMLDRVLNAVGDGKWDVEKFTDSKPSSEVLKIVKRLAQHFETET